MNVYEKVFLFCLENFQSKAKLSTENTKHTHFKRTRDLTQAEHTLVYRKSLIKISVESFTSCCMFFVDFQLIRITIIVVYDEKYSQYSIESHKNSHKLIFGALGLSLDDDKLRFVLIFIVLIRLSVGSWDSITIVRVLLHFSWNLSWFSSENHLTRYLNLYKCCDTLMWIS